MWNIFKTGTGSESVAILENENEGGLPHPHKLGDFQNIGVCLLALLQFCLIHFFFLFDSLCPINNLSVMQGRVFLG